MARRFTLVFVAAAVLMVWSVVSRNVAAQSITEVAPNGTVHLERTVPIPDTISPQAQELLRHQPFVPQKPLATLADKREFLDRFQQEYGGRAAQLYPVRIENSSIAGVPVRLIHPVNSSQKARHRILINLHGGGFLYDSGSLTENIAVAHLTDTTVVAVLYRLAPEHPFPAAVDDALAVYRETLKSYAPEEIGLYGTSAGAVLAAELCVRLEQLHLRLPAALGFFTGSADLNHVGDTERLFSVDGLAGGLESLKDTVGPYIGTHDPRDPALSPIYADLSVFPPTLCISGTRDLLLSQTSLFQRALLRSGVDARLVVFEAMAHAHWSFTDLPESKEAFEIMARFFNQHVRRASRRAENPPSAAPKDKKK
jgi:monoterpene epsilon-lactone hydrolase